MTDSTKPTLTTAQVSELLGVTRQRLHVLAREGRLVRTGRGRWELEPVRMVAAERGISVPSDIGQATSGEAKDDVTPEADQASAGSTPGTAEDIARRTAMAKLENLELQREERRVRAGLRDGELIRREDAHRWGLAVGTLVRLYLTNRFGSIVLRLAQATEPDEVAKILQHYGRDAVEEIRAEVDKMQPPNGVEA
jgi:hypothetical protein